MSVSHKETMSKLILTVKHYKRTLFMDPKEELYFMHFLKDDPTIGSYIRSQMRVNPTFRRDILKQNVCIKCEGFTFFHKGGVMCPSCGHWSPDKTVTVKDHIKTGGYK